MSIKIYNVFINIPTFDKKTNMLELLLKNTIELFNLGKLKNWPLMLFSMQETFNSILQGKSTDSNENYIRIADSWILTFVISRLI